MPLSDHRMSESGPLPGVSLLCPTYNRFPAYGHLLAECVESYRRQDYAGPMELLILNDCGPQTILCDTPNVRVVNHPTRFRTLGEKRNELVRLARGDLLCPWDDDDLALAHRVRQAVEHLSTAHYWKPRACFYWESGKPPRRDHGGVGHNAGIFRRDAWEQAGGYPATSGNEDLLLDLALCRQGVLPPPLPEVEMPSYIYRWRVSPTHISRVAGGPPHDPHAPHYAAIGQRAIMPGTFVIKPKWQLDYEAMCREHVAAVTFRSP